jgi:hypothetical protein
MELALEPSMEQGVVVEAVVGVAYSHPDQLVDLYFAEKHLNQLAVQFL